MKKFYLTTPLYYVNDVPHIGHAYTTIAADILARWNRLQGKNVFFLTGTDEHGAKIAEAAEKHDEEPKVYVDRIAGEFKRLWSVLNISNDDFIQTTEERHKKVVQYVFEKLLSTGDIYKGVYEDWYCIHDESYFSASELIEGKCPNCKRDVQKLKEDSYFFRLSKFGDPLLSYYEKHPEFLSPPSRANEILNFVKDGLRDLSVSRTRVKWGVPLKSDPAHVVYVWFDALLNYVSVLGYQGEKSEAKFSSFWPADLHLVGKEIFRFHTVIWPAMLMALGLPLPHKVLAHGWWTVEGTKMSKSLGNVVDPHALVAKYGTDVFRYFLFREVPFGADGDFSEKSLVQRANAELSNNLGNLLQRTTTLLLKNFNGEIRAQVSTSILIENPAAYLKKIETAFDQCALGDVLEFVLETLAKTNKFIDDKAPWKLGPDKQEELSQILTECLRTLKTVCLFLHPFMPQKTEEAWTRMGEKTSLAKVGGELLDKLRANLPLSFAVGQTVLKGEPLFMRIAPTLTKKIDGK